MASKDLLPWENMRSGWGFERNGMLKCNGSPITFQGKVKEFHTTAQIGGNALNRKKRSASILLPDHIWLGKVGAERDLTAMPISGALTEMQNQEFARGVAQISASWELTCELRPGCEIEQDGTWLCIALNSSTAG